MDEPELGSRGPLAQLASFPRPLLLPLRQYSPASLCGVTAHPARSAQQDRAARLLRLLHLWQLLRLLRAHACCPPAQRGCRPPPARTLWRQQH
eukprot:356323-Chlamydomonas_euryale.AAC.11